MIDPINKKKKRTSFNAGLEAALGGAGVAGIGMGATGLAVSSALNGPDATGTLHRFGAVGAPPVDDDYRETLREYTDRGSTAAQFHVLGVGVPDVMLAARGSPLRRWLVPKDAEEWEPEHYQHYKEFQAGPLNGLMQLHREAGMEKSWAHKMMQDEAVSGLSKFFEYRETPTAPGAPAGPAAPALGSDDPNEPPPPAPGEDPEAIATYAKKILESEDPKVIENAHKVLVGMRKQLPEAAVTGNVRGALGMSSRDFYPRLRTEFELFKQHKGYGEQIPLPEQPRAREEFDSYLKQQEPSLWLRKQLQEMQLGHLFRGGGHGYEESVAPAAGTIKAVADKYAPWAIGGGAALAGIATYLWHRRKVKEREEKIQASKNSPIIRSVENRVNLPISDAARVKLMDVLQPK